MPFGRYTCGVQRHIVLDGIPDPEREVRFVGQTQAKTRNCKLLLPPGEQKRRSGTSGSGNGAVIVLNLPFMAAQARSAAGVQSAASLQLTGVG